MAQTLSEQALTASLCEAWNDESNETYYREAAKMQATYEKARPILASREVHEMDAAITASAKAGDLASQFRLGLARSEYIQQRLRGATPGRPASAGAVKDLAYYRQRSRDFEASLARQRYIMGVAAEVTDTPEAIERRRQAIRQSKRWALFG
jgi:hypothetical protein